MIFEMELNNEDYNSIDDKIFIADFDIWKYLCENKKKLLYSIKFLDNNNFDENFIKE